MGVLTRDHARVWRAQPHHHDLASVCRAALAWGRSLGRVAAPAASVGTACFFCLGAWPRARPCECVLQGRCATLGDNVAAALLAHSGGLPALRAARVRAEGYSP